MFSQLQEHVSYVQVYEHTELKTSALVYKEPRLLRLLLNYKLTPCIMHTN